MTSRFRKKKSLENGFPFVDQQEMPEMIGNMVLLAPTVTSCRGQAWENEPISCADSSDGPEAGPIAPTSEVENFLVRIAPLKSSDNVSTAARKKPVISV